MPARDCPEYRQPMWSAEDLGIPSLDPGMQAIDPPPLGWLKWGTVARDSVVEGYGYHYYCADYKFSTIWLRPARLVLSRCACVVEANFTTVPGMAVAEVLWGIYRKRRLARWWQDRGVRVVADLNVHPESRHLGLLGVPEGWRTYAIRKHHHILEDGKGRSARAIAAAHAELEVDYRLAAHHAGTDPIFTVFGGGRPTRSFCLDRGWRWVPEDQRRARGTAAPEVR